MIVWLVLLALVAGWVLRVVLARRGRASFCDDGECVTLALRINPKPRGLGWKHGFARRNGDVVEWRAEYKLGPGADMSLDLNDLHLTDHRPVVKGETMLSDLCELVSGLYKGERIELGIPKNELPTFLAWVRSEPPAA